ncbi:hypothetical protein HPP92_005279 [Vanilla planifolia]|uniref:Uncharacterized protein n=1 Tax=Vanilla planifolia TaxID=51239 RepID=A0A835RL28_VANPL|nr:hypothetical protein HPP92_005566 [Vanilla planifolia]KAG0494285.1 hypothetical protein HPP92_005279 [Vanilla planifolia]
MSRVHPLDRVRLRTTTPDPAPFLRRVPRRRGIGLASVVSITVFIGPAERVRTPRDALVQLSLLLQNWMQNPVSFPTPRPCGIAPPIHTWAAR